MKNAGWPPRPGDIDDDIGWPVAVFEADGYPLVAPGLAAALELFEYGMWDEISAAFDSASYPLEILERSGVVSIRRRGAPDVGSFATSARAALLSVFRESRWRRIPATGKDRTRIEALSPNEVVTQFFARFTRLEKLVGVPVKIAWRSRLRIVDFIFIPLWLMSAPVFLFGALNIFGSDWRVLTVVLIYALSSVFYFRILASRLHSEAHSAGADRPSSDEGSTDSSVPGVEAARHVAKSKPWWWRLSRLDLPIEFLVLILIIVITLIATVLTRATYSG
jgi:hypothetical protein